MGLPRDLAYRLASQTVLGAAQMVRDTNVHPGVLKDDVTSAAGSTAAGLHVLEQKGEPHFAAGVKVLEWFTASLSWRACVMIYSMAVVSSKIVRAWMEWQIVVVFMKCGPDGTAAHTDPPPQRVLINTSLFKGFSFWKLLCGGGWLQSANLQRLIWKELKGKLAQQFHFSCCARFKEGIVNTTTYKSN
jgi:hypothetical protein